MLELICDINKTYSCRKLFIGDFNFSNINWSDWTLKSSGDNSSDAKFVACLRHNLLLQHVTGATRSRDTNTPHTLDLVITREDFVGEVLNLSPLGKSDHSVLHFECELICSSYTHANKYNYNKGY